VPAAPPPAAAAPAPPPPPPAGGAGAILLLPSFDQGSGPVEALCSEFGLGEGGACGWCALTAARLLADVPPDVTVPALLARLRAALSAAAFVPALRGAMLATRVFRDDFLARHGGHFSPAARCPFDRASGFSKGMCAVFELSDVVRGDASLPPGAAFFRARYVDPQFPREATAQWKEKYGSSPADAAVYAEEAALGPPPALHPPPPRRGAYGGFNGRFAEGFLDLPPGSALAAHPAVVAAPGAPGVGRAGRLLPLHRLLEGDAQPFAALPRAYVVDTVGHYVAALCVRVVAGADADAPHPPPPPTGALGPAEEAALARAGAYLARLVAAAGGAPVPVTLVLDSARGDGGSAVAAHKLAAAPALHAAAHGGARGGRAAVLRAGEEEAAPPAAAPGWSCRACTLENAREALECAACFAPRAPRGASPPRPPAARAANPSLVELPDELVDVAALSARLFAGTQAFFEEPTEPSVSTVIARTPLRGALLHANFLGAAATATAAAAAAVTNAKGGAPALLIVQCSDDHVGQIRGAAARVEVLELPLRDASHPPQLETADPAAPLNRALARMEAARAAGVDVLVNCKVGVSRSTGVLLAHLMEGAERLSLRAAWAADRAARAIACPNPGFAAQLMRREVRLRGGRSSIPPRAMLAHPVFVYTFDTELEGERYYQEAGGW
jgi:hypothetical protein